MSVETELPLPWFNYAPDGLAGGASGSARRPGRITAGLANAVLAQLPMAVALLDGDLHLHFWNEAAAELFAVPPVVAAEMPHLSHILAAVPDLSAHQQGRIVAFVAGRLEASNRGEPECFLRLSLARERRLCLRVLGVDARRWMLVIDDGRMFGVAGHGRAGQGVTGHGDAWLDALTGLSNRRHFNDVLREMTETAAVPAALLLIDLDRFKPVNDRLGPAVGDALLCLVAQRLLRETRGDDLLARQGGDEFAILLESAKSADALGDRIVESLSRPFVVDGHAVDISASVGIARFPDHGATGSDLLRHAELALSSAKADGGRLCRAFDPAMGRQERKRRDLETDLRRALTLGEMSLVYQPQVDIGTGTLTGFEALLRWRHPVRGEVPPGVFIPVAEACGCMTALGEWALKAACNEAVLWPAPISVSVNVSPRQLEDCERLVRAVETALAISGLSPSRLELEITESGLPPDATRVLETLHRFRDRGIRIVMDDFGSGSASLSQLRSFPFDRVTIDRSLIAGLRGETDAAAVVRTISVIGRGLGMTTTAKGVETAEQASLVAADGCTGMQGYLISQPVSPAGVEALVSRYRMVEA